MTKEKWIKSPWTISIGTAIFSLLLTMAYDYFKEKPLLSTIGIIIKWVGNLMWNILFFDIKVWWIIIFLAFILFVMYLIARFKNESGFAPSFIDYREDTIKGWRWSWDWKFSERRKAWMITDLKAHCPICNTPMIEESISYQTHFDCPRCDFLVTNKPSDESHKVERIILDNIDRKEKSIK